MATKDRPAEAEPGVMDVNTAVDLAEQYVGRVVRPFERVLEVLRLAKDTQGQAIRLTAEVRGLTEQKALLERDIASLGDKAQLARVDADRFIAQAAADQRAAAERMNEAVLEAARVGAQLTTEARERERALDAEHQKRRVEREQEVARLDGQVSTLTASLKALKAGLPD